MFSARMVTRLRLAAVALVLCVLLPRGTFAVPLSYFYPSSSDTDVVLPQDDDSAVNQVDFDSPVPFFGVSHTTAFVRPPLCQLMI